MVKRGDVTERDMRWLSQDWLSNTIMAALLAAGGSYGETLLSLLFGALVVLAFALLWRAVRVRNPDTGWLARLLWLTFGLLVAGPVVGVRVQTVDLVMVSLTIWVLWHFVTDRRRIWPGCRATCCGRTCRTPRWTGSSTG